MGSVTRALLYANIAVYIVLAVLSRNPITIDDRWLMIFGQCNLLVLKYGWFWQLFTAMFYPFNYGIVPQTLMPDGDPADVLVISYEPLLPGTVIRARPIGILEMEDEEGIDHKIIAVPVEKVDPRFAKVKDIKDLPEALLNQIKHFFEHYKELEPGKWTKVRGFHGAEEAKRMIKEAIENYAKKRGIKA